MFLNLIEFNGALELGLIFTLVAIGVYISFRILNFPDMTVDGSFPLGGAVCTTLIVAGYNPLLATVLSIIAGVMSGLITAILANQIKMLNLLAGILTMTALYSINIRIMGRPNMAIIGEDTLFNQDFSNISILIPLSFIVLSIIIIIYFFFKTKLGLSIRAAGNNPRMGRSHGINDKSMIMIGLSLSNALVALAGALFAQINGFADVSMGVGTVIIGLAAMIIGETIFNSKTVGKCLLGCLIGSILYRLLVAKALNISDHASDLNLITAILVTLTMFLRRKKA